MQIDLEDMIREVSNKVLYIHRKKTDGTIFYVGIGNPRRPYSFYRGARSPFWDKTAAKHGVIVEVLETGLTIEEAKEKEIYLIKKIGRRDLNEGTLVNHTDGGDGGNGFCNRVIDINNSDIYVNVAVYARYVGKHPSNMHTSLNDKKDLPIRKLSNDNLVEWYESDTYFGIEEEEIEPYDIKKENIEDDKRIVKEIKEYAIKMNGKPNKYTFKKNYYE